MHCPGWVIFQYGKYDRSDAFYGLLCLDLNTINNACKADHSGRGADKYLHLPGESRARDFHYESGYMNVI
jgi:hypothetical protein